MGNIAKKGTSKILRGGGEDMGTVASDEAKKTAKKYMSREYKDPWKEFKQKRRAYMGRQTQNKRS